MDFCRGKTRIGRNADECARREIFEETHLTGEKDGLQRYDSFQNLLRATIRILTVFKVTDFEGKLISDEESREGTLEWVPYDQVLTKQGEALGKVTMRFLSGF